LRLYEIGDGFGATGRMRRPDIEQESKINAVVADIEQVQTAKKLFTFR
jgi:hypothetical protein